ncbi:MAG: methyltransferase [Gammaproteobacteria bacterium]|nr:MAG: methyltransferase [Gammaproteobacteria bacterium]
MLRQPVAAQRCAQRGGGQQQTGTCDGHQGIISYSHARRTRPRAAYRARGHAARIDRARRRQARARARALRTRHRQRLGRGRGAGAARRAPAARRRCAWPRAARRADGAGPRPRARDPAHQGAHSGRLPHRGRLVRGCASARRRARAGAALEVARRNVRRHRLARRVRLRKSDHFRALGRATYDIILSNPPYVGARELAGLPAEYRHEPRVALAAGSAGLDSVRIILQEARRHLRPRGVLIVEVGNTERAVRRAFRRLPFVWLEFARGGGGVFLLSREQLQGPQATFSQ